MTKMTKMKKMKKMKKNNKTAIAIGLVALALMPEIAHAAPWDGPLQKLIDLLTGTTARLFAILSIIILGFMAMTGRINWGMAASVVGGIILIFGASYLANLFIDSVGSTI